MELSQVIDEIKRIPPERLSEVYHVIHSFRLGLESDVAQGKASDIMQFAGCWQDIPSKQFDEFLVDIQTRRQQASLGRPNRETLFD